MCIRWLHAFVMWIFATKVKSNRKTTSGLRQSLCKSLYSWHSIVCILIWVATFFLKKNHSFLNFIFTTLHSSLLELTRERNPNLASKLIKSFVSFCAADIAFVPNRDDPISLYTKEEIEYFNACGAPTNSTDDTTEPILFWVCNIY